jgi:hypothetical protein
MITNIDRYNFVARIERTHNMQIERNKNNKGFDRQTKSCASNKQCR